MTANDWSALLGLVPHPEGGCYRETYRSPETIPATGLPARYGAARALGTAIYFLLRAGEFSALHRLRSDELWHFYAGAGLEVVVLTPEGDLQCRKLGTDPAQGERPQVVVAQGCWFGARVAEATGYALVGCTVAPGFDFADFTLGRRAELVRAFPRHRAVIESLTRN